jgi:hypothetical protein
MRKLKNQKRLSRSIEKIFISKKEERPLNEVNQDPLLIKPKPEIIHQKVDAPITKQPAQPSSTKTEILPEAKKDTKITETENAAIKDNQGSAQN